MKIYSLLGVMMLLSIACNPTCPDTGTEPRLDILHHAGEMPDSEWNFLAYPAHYGMMNGMHVFLLTKAKNVGSARSIHPVGMMTTIEDDKDHHWIIANDAHDDYKIKGLDSVDDLMTHHNGIKSTLERWIINRNGIGQVQLKGWKDAPAFDETNNQ